MNPIHPKGMSEHAYHRMRERFGKFAVKQFLAFPRRPIAVEKGGETVWEVDCAKPPAYIVVALDGTVKTVLPANYLALRHIAVRGNEFKAETEKIKPEMPVFSRHVKRELQRIDPSVRTAKLAGHQRRAAEKNARRMGMSLDDYLDYMDARRECILSVTKKK